MASRETRDQWPAGNKRGNDFNHRRKRAHSPPKVVLQTKEALTKHAEKIAEQANKHEQLINKVTYCLGVLSFGTFCFLLGSRPQDIPYLYCLFFIIVAPLRWIYYRIKKWHYYLLDFCYYANAIFMTMLLFFPNNEKLFMVCFSFSEGPLAWALIVWRCSLVFSSIDKIVSVLIHLLPGIVFFIIRWWDPSTFPRHIADDTGPWPAWPLVDSSSSLWTWLFFVPLVAYCVWQAIYFLIVEGLRRQRLLSDPQVMTSYRELKRKAERANNIWWRLSGLLGDERRVIMYAAIQAAFTVATLALTVPLFKSYRLHVIFEIFKLSATVWNGGNFVFEVMPRQVVAKKEKAKENANPAVDVNGMKKKQNRENSKSDGMIATTNVGNRTCMKDLSCYVNTVVGSVTVKNEDICALCRRSSAENLTNFLQSSGDIAPLENDRQDSESATFQSFWSPHDVDRIKYLRRGLSGCNKSPDSQRGKMERNGQVACVG